MAKAQVTRPAAKRAGVSVPRGKRMIEVKVYFRTDRIEPGRGVIRRKHAWESGIVQMRGNKAHGISGAPSRENASTRSLSFPWR